jgi:hypothetical protein
MRILPLLVEAVRLATAVDAADPVLLFDVAAEGYRIADWMLP